MTNNLRKRSNSLRSTVSVAAIAWLTAVSSASAQDADDSNGSTIEEIIVTAEKREASLQDTAISMTVMGGDTMQDMGISTIEELQLFVPGVSLINDAMAIVYIRGIGTSAFGVGTDPSSTVHYDGVYIPRPTTGYQDMFDVERIEVLRGPQGVLFGRNSVGGTLNIISKMPTDEFEGTVGATLGNMNKRTFGATLSGPLSETAKGRISIMKNDRGGRFKDVLNGREYQDQDTFAMRGSLVFDPSENFQVILRADYAKENEAGFPTIRQPIVGGTGERFAPDLIAAGVTVVGDPTRQVALDQDVFQNLEVYGVSAEMSYDLDAVTVRSITSYRKSDVSLLIDVDATELDLRWVGFDENSKTFTQELQVLSNGSGPLQWVGGLYYLNEKGVDDLGLQQNPAVLLRIPGSNTTKAYAVFGQASYEISDRLKATAGLRYNYEKKDFGMEIFVNGTSVAAASPSANWNKLTPHFALDYAVTEDVMIYASVSNGFKSGGFQLGEGSPFQPEVLWAYQAGVKAVFLDNRLQANIGAFLYDFTNLQVVEFINGVSSTTNAGKADIRGFEAEFLAKPAEGWDFNATIGYLDAQYEVFSQSPGVDLAGNRLPSTPKLTFSLGGQYRFPLQDMGDLTIRGDWAYKGQEFYKPNNFPQYSQDAFSIFNARMTYEHSSGSWQLAAYVTNLFDKDFFTYKTTGVDATSTSDDNLPLGVHGEPRQFGVKAVYNF